MQFIFLVSKAAAVVIFSWLMLLKIYIHYKAKEDLQNEVVWNNEIEKRLEATAC